MKTLGIVTEYNPFHKGHAYMIAEAKKKANADRVVVVMSGSFVQRGEPAIFDKWTRTEAALKNGADLVLELPVLFAASNAETFARAAVRLLEESGIVDILCFGSESGDLSSMQEAARLMENETEEFQNLLKEQLDQGLSYPAARAKALETVSQISSEILSQPNHILGLEYLKALNRYNCSMEPMTIRREGSYHSPSLTDGFASAAAIRKALAENRSTEVMPQLPENTHDVYNKALSLGTAPVFLDAFTPALHYKLRLSSADELRQIAEVVEGLENRILHSIDSCYDMVDILDFIKTKRYTRTKIQRILLHILLDIKEQEISYYMNLPKMPYIRVLGFRREDTGILADLTERAKCPVLTNLKKAPDLLNEDGLALLALEKTATDLHAMAYPNPIYRTPNQDFTKPLVIL
ncbi:MAG: nucleotidyltransferase [Bacillota bacterium]|nr:nucleotidyltransferase [Bacillota bacterium]